MIRHGLDEEGRPGVASCQSRAFEIEQGRRLVLIERAIGEEMAMKRGDTPRRKAPLIFRKRDEPEPASLTFVVVSIAVIMMSVLLLR